MRDERAVQTEVKAQLAAAAMVSLLPGTSLTAHSTADSECGLHTWLAQMGRQEICRRRTRLPHAGKRQAEVVEASPIYPLHVKIKRKGGREEKGRGC